MHQEMFTVDMLEINNSSPRVLLRVVVKGIRNSHLKIEVKRQARGNAWTGLLFDQTTENCYFQINTLLDGGGGQGVVDLACCTTTKSIHNGWCR